MESFNFNNKSVLITGGTGSFGKSFVSSLLKKYPKIKKIIIFSRDELKQSEMKKLISKKHLDKIRFFIGDIRDQKRLNMAFYKIDIVIHAAALKQVDAGENDPLEFVKTNILGSQNVIEASLNSNVKKIIALSTDKAAAPTSLYGATKLATEKLFSSANNLVGDKDIKFSIVRYGNVLGSRGSILPTILKKIKTKENIYLTSKKMTRFIIKVEDSIKMISWVLQNMKGGETFVPKLPTLKIFDLIKFFFKEKKIKTMGIRPGEKIHEEMITENDSIYTYDLGKYYVICNPLVLKSYNFYKNKKKYPSGLSYSSANNKHQLSSDGIKKMISEYVKINNISFNT